VSAIALVTGYLKDIYLLLSIHEDIYFMALVHGED
jgi:hypothetical protein